MKTIIYDGVYPSCSGLKTFAEQQNSNSDLEFIPFQDESLEIFLPDLGRKNFPQLYTSSAQKARFIEGLRLCSN